MTHIGDEGGGMNRNVTSRQTCPCRTAWMSSDSRS